MWQNVIVLLVLGLTLFFIGRKLYHQFRKAADTSQQISCGCACSGCSDNKCNSQPVADSDRGNSPPPSHSQIQTNTIISSKENRPF
ncbi:MAG: FeoB-associated Cys-rich membrane protein [Proteobacteria bacterium]|nr:FeoB-associated Cys-rich membrane protein [Pseudomonadota bacterium]MBU1057083.1 FeoB-associated Cys-rich membrane protein [Pseudomonadota bacterium]